MPQQPNPSTATLKRPSGREAASASSPHDPPFEVLLPLFLLLVLLLWLWRRWSVGAAWRRYAKNLQGEIRMRNRFSPACIAATFRDRPFLLETATSHEDETPYYHTRGALPIGNPASFILGVRRKSLLEEMQTRKELSSFDLNDPDFERRFFVVCNQPDVLPLVLTKEARRELSRYHDVEIYVRLQEIEWRRAGEVSDLKAMERLNHLIADMAEAIDALPPSDAPLSLRLADEQMIAKGI
ncbi:hypothetical protein CWRG_01714 [Chthonomonas calidirosea]|uniref:Uncharacterized protein n=1 Tax=Chthonomonas calidirosea (strain DSM 23976 / ICMP 18418 / T49) TaxID=1303518 RepID=S0EWB3_CHTCT|nr:hypothetical protein [Chthonomonas calidirosea]CCW36169.1 hypothetical protein CCALI_02365 [Chthonomonas calidirosea T49]CEK17077.1 hypothetical protein CP488_01728 [Chthonomonas calidirosea]CEK17078.1 hypothetical protein CWRG_01714 [Chthonomonas calidirosea]CEK18135.1 hypothetical protein CTKA_01731 [Chthonomonas calidirosea]